MTCGIAFLIRCIFIFGHSNAEMMKKSIALSLLCFVLFTTQIRAQSSFAIGLLGGISEYKGDLSEGINFDETNPAIGILFDYNLNPFVTMRLGFYGTTLEGADKNYPDDQDRFVRNLSFRTAVTEFSLIMQLNVMGYDVEDRRFSPYLFAGIGDLECPRRTGRDDQRDQRPTPRQGNLPDLCQGRAQDQSIRPLGRDHPTELTCSYLE